MDNSNGYQNIIHLLDVYNKTPFLFQLQTWNAIEKGESGLVNAPTGSTISAFKYGNGLNSGQSIIETTGVSFTLPAGATVPLFITSCSLAAGSAPVFLHT